jgi:hypothetical protein
MAPCIRDHNADTVFSITLKAAYTVSLLFQLFQLIMASLHRKHHELKLSTFFNEEFKSSFNAFIAKVIPK